MVFLHYVFFSLFRGGVAVERAEEHGEEGEAARAPHRAQATRALTTLVGSTPVSFWSRPWYLYVKRSWS